nr:MAG TPA: hypothetical protein [Caudoviricetes sp.]
MKRTLSRSTSEPRVKQGNMGVLAVLLPARRVDVSAA